MAGLFAQPGAPEAASPEPWRDLYLYWQSRHVEGRPPARGELDPITEIPRLVPNLMLLEATADGGFEYRLVGSEVVALQGFDMTGKRAGSSPRFSRVLEEWLAALAFVRANAQPRLLYSSLGPQTAATNMVLLLPLHRPEGERLKVLGGLFRQGAFDANLQVENLSVREIPV